MIEDYLRDAYRLAAQSKDPSNQNGAILISQDKKMLSTGNNNFPIGVEFTKERSETRPKKYRYFEHAERNSIYQAARTGVKVFGSTMVCPWAACCDCARGIINAGVLQVFVHTPRMRMTPTRWKSIADEALKMLSEGGVRVTYFDMPVQGAPDVLVNGELWNPAHPLVKDIGNYSFEMGEVR